MDDDNARTISESIGELKQDRRLNAIEERLRAVEAALAGLKAELKMQRWILGLLFAMNAAVFAKLFLQ
jgi:hypothetical protein